MISNSNLILYTCVSKGTQILAEFTREPDLEALAHGCIEKTPQYHSMFSHTVRKKTYTFVIADPFVYFAIFDESILQQEGLWFLNRVRSTFEDLIQSGSVKVTDNLSSHCFQKQLDLVFREITALDLDLDLVDSSQKVANDGTRNPGLDSLEGKKMVPPLIKTPSNLSKGLKKKKRVRWGSNNDNVKELKVENKLDVDGDGCGVRELNFSMAMQKSSNLYVGDRQKAKQVWKKHVWVVLVLDVFVCVVLFGIWLWVCRGFKCMDG